MTQQQRDLKSVKFECTKCGACCRRPGHVELTGSDVEALMRFKEMDDVTFFETYNVAGFGEHFAIHVDDDLPCVFLDGDQCSVFDVRPTQCRTYPFWPELLNRDAWDEEKELCPGIGIGKQYSEKEVDALTIGIGSTKP